MEELLRVISPTLKYKCLIFWKWERKCRASDIANKDNYEIYEAIDTWQYTSINRDAIWHSQLLKHQCFCITGLTLARWPGMLFGELKDTLKSLFLTQLLLPSVSFDQQSCNMTHGPFCCHHWHWLSVTTLKWSPVMHQHQCICEAKKEGLVYVWGAVMIQKMQLDTLCVINVGRGGQC